MGHLVTTWVEQGGVIAVLVLMACESCGIPFPSEVIMPVAGAFAAHTSLGLAAVIVAGAVGNLLGSLVAWLLARRWGEPLLLGPGRRIGISPSHLELADGWFQRHGLVAVLVGRVLPVIRTYISFPAGLAGVEPGRFAVLTFIGALPWCALLAVAGYGIGANYDRVSGPIEKAAIVIAVIAAGLVLGWFIRGRRRASSGGAA